MSGRVAVKKDQEKVEIIGPDSVIPYKWMDDRPGGGNLGRAEFVFCPVWSRGLMRALHIFPKQQRVLVSRYTLPLSGRINTFSFAGSPGYPRCWRMGWCKEHKTISYEVYVPTNTDSLSFEFHFGNTIDIHFTKAEGLP